MKNKYNIISCLKLKDTTVAPPGHPRRYYTGPVRFFIKRFYTKFLFNKLVRFIVLFLFGSIWVGSLTTLPSLKIGLDQTTALPTDSYLQNYFSDVFDHLKVGAPAYFVIKENYPYHIESYQNKICSQPYCDTNSLTSVIYTSSQNAPKTTIASVSNSWLDAYLSWLIPLGDQSCCRILNATLNEDGSVDEYIKDFRFCDSTMSPKKYLCTTCIDPNNKNSNRPNPDEFGKYLPWFLSDVPNMEGCNLGGKASYSFSVNLNPDYYKENRTSDNPILSSNFMTYHITTVTSEEFIDALKKGILIAKHLSDTLQHEVFPYSVFYIFYQSYLNIEVTTLVSLAICAGAVIIVSAILFSFNWRMTMIVSSTIILMDVTNAGAMFLADMELNPVTVVNLIMLLGVNVEFVAHIARSYVSSREIKPIKRAKQALNETGSAIFSGIALTNFLGVVVLAFANSLIFKIYYFRMYSIGTLIGLVHGIVFLPVILSFFGPKGIMIRNETTMENHEQVAEDQENPNQQTDIVL